MVRLTALDDFLWASMGEAMNRAAAKGATPRELMVALHAVFLRAAHSQPEATLDSTLQTGIEYHRAVYLAPERV
jgi:hypothetical protein